ARSDAGLRTGRVSWLQLACLQAQRRLDHVGQGVAVYEGKRPTSPAVTASQSAVSMRTTGVSRRSGPASNRSPGRLNPSRSQSQNFLVDRAVVARLVERVGIGPDDVVVEIGPGRGIITAELARRCRRVIGVEVDPGL